MDDINNRTVAFFPSLKKMDGNPYWEMLAFGLEKEGIGILRDTPNIFNKAWLDAHIKQVKIIHLHFCQLFYATKEGKAKFSKLIMMVFLLIYARILGYRLVFTAHELEPTYWLEPKWIDKLGHFTVMRLSERVIVHCQNAEKLLSDTMGRKRGIYFIDHPNYISQYKNNITREHAREALNLSNEGLFIFMFFGGIRPNKGIEKLIKAFRSIKEEHFRLVISGAVNKPASYGQYLQALAGADKRIKFHFKHIPDDMIQYYMNAADVVVLPFNRILTSGSAILAMSFGRPVIASRMGCLTQLIEPGTGWLFDPGDIESLSGVMREAASSDLKKIGDNALNKVIPYTVESVCQQLQAVYFCKGTRKNQGI